MKSNNVRLVYSTDGSHKNICKKCGEQPCECKAVEPVNPAEVVAKIRVEKGGRGGKIVTVVFNLPYNPEYFDKILKKLKSQCGSGGAYKGGNLEIQGDHREKIKKFLEAAGFNVKLAGG